MKAIQTIPCLIALALGAFLLPQTASADLVAVADQVIEMRGLLLAQAEPPEAALPDGAAPAPAPLPPAAAAPTPDRDDGLKGATGLSPAAQLKLSPSQLYELAQQHQAAEALLNRALREPPVVAVVAPVASFAMIVLIVLLVVLYRSRKDKEIHLTLRLMVEKGAAIPAELLTPRPRAQVDLRRGVLLLALGLGYMLFMGILGFFEPDAWTGVGVGLVPIFLGIGYLLVWKLGKRDEFKN